LDVSRSSVRETLRALESNGIIEVRSGAGAFVSEDALVLNSMNDAIMRLMKRKDLVLQLLLVRGAIECLSAAQAASNIEPAQMTALIDLVHTQEGLIQSTDDHSAISKLASLDEEFHIALSKASGNEIIYEIISALVPAFSQDNQAIFVLEKGYKLVDEHRQILDAITQGDPLGAEKSMHKHIQRVIDEVREIRRNADQSLQKNG
jgi:GntR family transcriptional regulator, transcriptional repressor for pyruvate dehydrogenase complex